MSDKYPPPVMSNGKTWADSAWWSGSTKHDPPVTPPYDFDEAAALTWARCWAYIEERDLPPEVCQHIWPVVYGALNACANIQEGV